MIDNIGNLIVRKPASIGCESSPGIVLQSHLDMVCQSNADTPHDFVHDPIEPVLRDGWLCAERTTLGADNGIGVALMLAVLEDTNLRHGPIEALFTVDEEAGMGGARGLASDVLRGRLLINLDTETWGHFYLGCAGGMDVDVRRAGHPMPIPDGYMPLRLDVRGLRGGHSGVDIHEGRGNAIKLLVRVLRELESHWPLVIATLRGGTARNALPREAHATFALPADGRLPLESLLTELQTLFCREFTGVDEQVSVSCSPCEVDEVMDEREQEIWLASLHAAPHGVRRMSVRFPDVVETSDNLGIVDLTPKLGVCTFMVRSLVDSAGIALADEITSLFSLSGTRVELSGHYPGWEPNPKSPLLSLCQSVFQETFGNEARPLVVHAGLECGIIGSKYPKMDMVSFGPTIRGAHAPGEMVEVQTVEHCWRLLKTILDAAV